MKDKGNNLYMNRIRQYLIIILIVIPIAILVVARTASRDHFKNDARKLAESSFSHSNIMTWKQFDADNSGILIINLGDQSDQMKKHQANRANIPVKELLGEESQKILRKHKGRILLYSGEPAISARAWMLLSELGYRNVYILLDEADNEVMKHTFSPDSATTGAGLTE